METMRRLYLTIVLLLGALASAPAVHACPMCKVANECDENPAVRDARPRAYMYSILFMLSMPATLLSGFGIGFYRLHRQHQLAGPGATDADSGESV